MHSRIMCHWPYGTHTHKTISLAHRSNAKQPTAYYFSDGKITKKKHKNSRIYLMIPGQIVISLLRMATSLYTLDGTNFWDGKGFWMLVFFADLRVFFRVFLKHARYIYFTIYMIRLNHIYKYITYLKRQLEIKYEKKKNG